MASSTPVGAFFSATSQITLSTTVFSPFQITIERPFEKTISTRQPENLLHLCFQCISEPDGDGFDEPAFEISLNGQVKYQSSCMQKKQCLHLPITPNTNVIRATVQNTIDQQFPPVFEISQLALKSDLDEINTVKNTQKNWTISDLTIEKNIYQDDLSLLSLKLVKNNSIVFPEVVSTPFLVLYAASPFSPNDWPSIQTTITSEIPLDFESARLPDHIISLNPHQPFWHILSGQTYLDSRYPDSTISFATALIPHGDWIAVLAHDFDESSANDFYDNP
ncbi:MAG: hypothetical protein WAU07_04255 [Microgenomates group bacterium]